MFTLKSRFKAKLSLLLSLVIIGAVVIAGCGSSSNIGGASPNDEHALIGQIIDIADGRLLVIEGDEGEIPTDILDKSLEELVQTGGYGLYWVQVDNPGQYEIGQLVKVWFDGPILESYPAQGAAERIELLEK